MIRGLEHLCCEERLRELGLFQPGEEKAAGRPYHSLPVPGEACKKVGERLLTRACSDRTRGKRFETERGQIYISY